MNISRIGWSAVVDGKEYQGSVQINDLNAFRPEVIKEIQRLLINQMTDTFCHLDGHVVQDQSHKPAKHRSFICERCGANTKQGDAT